MDVKRIGIVRGGVGKHYTSSLKKGGDVISHIVENLSDKYKVIDILIDKNGVWHIGGIPIKPVDLVHKIDLVWDVSQHSGVSSVLDRLSIPFIGNGFFERALENNTNMLRTHVGGINIQMPKSIVSPKNAREVFEKFSSPWIVKMNNEIKLIKTFDELTETIKDKKDVVVEEFISGKVGSMHSVSGFRGADIYTFPLINIFGVFSTAEKEKIDNQIKNLHKHLGIKHYLKSDFVLHPKRGIFLTSITSFPNFKKGSHLDQSCEFVGAKMHHVSEHILNRALNKKA